MTNNHNDDHDDHNDDPDYNDDTTTNNRLKKDLTNPWHEICHKSTMGKEEKGNQMHGQQQLKPKQGQNKNHHDEDSERPRTALQSNNDRFVPHNEKDELPMKLSKSKISFSQKEEFCGEPRHHAKKQQRKNSGNDAFESYVDHDDDGSSTDGQRSIKSWMVWRHFEQERLMQSSSCWDWFCCWWCCCCCPSLAAEFRLYCRRFVGRNTALIIAVFIVVLGTVAATGFMWIGIGSANEQEAADFQQYAVLTTHGLYKTFEEYVRVGSWVHLRCRHKNFTRRDYNEMYQYIRRSTTLSFKAVQFIPYVTHEERSYYEMEARQYYEKYYPYINYSGFIGFNTLNATKPEPRTNQSYYFPIHYLEPVAGNEGAIDLDLYSSPSRIRSVNDLYENKKPIMSDRLKLVQSDPKKPGSCGDHVGPSFAVVIMSPGFNVTTGIDEDSNVENYDNEQWPRDIVSIVVCIPDLLQLSTESQTKSSTVYIHDLSHEKEGTSGVFLGGIRTDVTGDTKSSSFIHPTATYATNTTTHNSSSSSSKSLSGEAASTRTVTFVPEVSLEELQTAIGSRNGRIKKSLYYEEIIRVANRDWALTIIDDSIVLGNVTQEDNDNDDWFGQSDSIPLIVTGGVVIFFASLVVGVWVLHNTRRMRQFNKMRAAADSERAALVLENAKRATEAERELNDFLAHEVRNPVSAAMSACSFLKMTLAKDEPFQEDGTLNVARDDVSIIDNSLTFVNDLLRNMLDMHRATANKLDLDMNPTGIFHDVLEPVSAMLQQRNESRIKMIIDCPQDLIVVTDPIRLKQVIMNLGRNSCKFVDQGFIRLSASIDNDTGFVVLYVDDSGTGIPPEKRTQLFTKYQASLDRLNQGTGIGLFLCQSLVNLMGGKIYLDDTYDSGVPGYPGTRFVVNLRMKPFERNLSGSFSASVQLPLVESQTETNGTGRDSALHIIDLPTVRCSEKDEANSSVPESNGGSIPRSITVLDELPDPLSVLFVDDDAILRKLFIRSIRGICPNCIIREAASGEAALNIVESTTNTKNSNSNNTEESNEKINQTENHHVFDLIFVDMYMASVEKQLLGTECVAAMRQMGIQSVICGLSANSKEVEFLEAGADAFIFKPFPCKPDAIRAELLRLLRLGRRSTQQGTSLLTSVG